MNSARCVSFINGLINILHNARMLSRLSICRPGQTRVHQGAESNSSFFSVLWALVFMPWLRFDKKAWVNNWKDRQAALQPAAYQSLLHENTSVPTGRATGRKILSQIRDVFAEYTDRSEIVLFLLSHLYPDKIVKGHAGRGWTAFEKAVSIFQRFKYPY